MKSDFFVKLKKDFGIKGILILVLLVLILGGIGGFLFDQLALPALSKLSFFSNIPIFHTESPLVINRREEIRINEGINNTEVINQSKNSLALIYQHEGAFDSGNFLVSAVFSGVIVSNDGLIVSSAHGVDKTQSFTAVMPDGRSVSAGFLAKDGLTGLAFFKVPIQDLSIIRQAPSGDLSPSEKLMAIKLAENLNETVSTPVNVSAAVAPQPSLSNIYDLSVLSSNIPLSPILSEDQLGMILFDQNAQMVGIITEVNGHIVAVRSEDLSLAISNISKDLKITWPNLKLTYQIFGPVQTALFRLPKNYGVLLKSGTGNLHEDDFIFEVDGKTLGPEQTFQDTILSLQPGGKVNVKLIRDSLEKEVEISL